MNFRTSLNVRRKRIIKGSESASNVTFVIMSLSLGWDRGPMFSPRPILGIFADGQRFSKVWTVLSALKFVCAALTVSVHHREGGAKTNWSKDDMQYLCMANLPSSQKYLSIQSVSLCSLGTAWRKYWVKERSNTLPKHSYPLPEHGANGLLIQSVSCTVKSWSAVGWALQTAQGHYRLIRRPVTALIAPSESWTPADGYTPIPTFHLLFVITMIM